MVPETRYARLGDLHLAYQVVGEGPPDILLLDQWFGNLDAQWDVPPLAELRERLASFGRLIMFDKRGTGLSDPIPTSSLPTLEEFMEDIPAVLDTVGADRPALIANIGGGILAMPFAAAHPERISSLILVDCFARFLEAPDYPDRHPDRGARAGPRDRRGRHRPRRDGRPLRAVGRERRAAPSRLGQVRAQRGHARQHEGDRPPDLRERRPRRACRPSASRRSSSIGAMPSASASSTVGTSPSTSRTPGTSSCRAPTTSSGPATSTRWSPRSRRS